jgi:hypothetical protein
MVKNLADELTDILNWIENPGLVEHAREEANRALFCFCRGLVVGLRAGSVQMEVPKDVAFNPDFAKDWAEADRRANAERRQKAAADRRRNQENAQRNEPKCDPEVAKRSLDLMEKIDEGFRAALRPTDEDMRIRPVNGEALKEPGCMPDFH